MDSKIILYLKKIIKTREFGYVSDYDMIINFLEKEDGELQNKKIYSKLIRNFYNFFDIKIPDEFIDLIKSKIELKKDIDKIKTLNEV